MITTLPQLFVRVHSRYTSSAFVAVLTAFAKWLMEHEYPVRYAQRLVFRARNALEASGRQPNQSWTQRQLDRAFYRFRPRRIYGHALHTFGAFLKSANRLQPEPARDAHFKLLLSYQGFLEDVRGVRPTTAAQHLAEVSALLRRALPNGGPLERLNYGAIEKHIQSRARQLSRRTLRSCVNCLRIFLRYCHDQRLISKRLDALDQPILFRSEKPPRALDWPIIQKFLRSIPHDRRTGWRDFMAMHLMAHYGLRTGELTRLKVDSINWHARTLLVEQYKTRAWLTLPLMDKTVGLLRRYLLKGRPATRRPELFLSGCAPCRPMTKFSVSQVFKVRAHRSGLPITHASAYSLRHSFAMRLFARGVGIKAIGDLMGHSSLVSTSIYLRLQINALREVALPVPTSTDGDGGTI